MIKDLVFIAGILVLVSTLKAQQPLPEFTESDTSTLYIIELSDKTLLSGKILENTGTHFIFQDVTIGRVNIPHSQISRVTGITGEQYCIVTTSDNKKFTGRLISQDSLEVKLLTDNLGELTIPNSRIKEFRLIEQQQLKEGKYYFANPHPTRYFFGPTAIPLEKGEGYFQNAYILANSVQYGTSANFSIGGGFFIPVVFFISPKFGFRVGKSVYLGGGILAASTFTTDVNIGFGVGYGSVTLGNTENNFTFSGGWGAVKEENYDYSMQTSGREWKAAKKPMFSLSAMVRLSPRLSMVTENWVFATKEYEYDNFWDGDYEYYYKYRSVLTLGFRILGERNSFDLAIGAVSIEGSTMGLPYFDYVFKF